MKRLICVLFVFSLMLLLFIGCDFGKSDDAEKSTQPDYYVEFSVEGATYRLTYGSTVESAPYVKVNGAEYNLFASAVASISEGHVGEDARGLQASFPIGQTAINIGDIQWMFFSKTNNMSEHFNITTSMTITITNDTSSVLQGSFSGTMDKDGAGSYPVTGSFKVKKYVSSTPQTTYLGILAEPETLKIGPGGSGVIYNFGVTNAKPNTYVIICDCTVAQGTWDSNNPGDFVATFTVNEGESASGMFMPTGNVTSRVELWVEGVIVKIFTQNI